MLDGLFNIQKIYADMMDANKVEDPFEKYTRQGHSASMAGIKAAQDRTRNRLGLFTPQQQFNQAVSQIYPNAPDYNQQMMTAAQRNAPAFVPQLAQAQTIMQQQRVDRAEQERQRRFQEGVQTEQGRLAALAAGRANREEARAQQLHEYELRQLQAQATLSEMQLTGEIPETVDVHAVETFQNGTVLIATDDGQTFVRDRAGNKLTGEEAAKALEQARTDEMDFESRALLQKGIAEAEVNTFNKAVSDAEDALGGLAEAYRIRELLELVDTGAWEAGKLQAKLLFGSEGVDWDSVNNAVELRNRMGASVISRLKESFGASFTEREGAKLEQFSASFSNTTESNIRLIDGIISSAESRVGRAVGLAADYGSMTIANDLRERRAFRYSGYESDKAGTDAQMSTSAPSGSDGPSVTQFTDENGNKWFWDPEFSQWFKK